MTFREKIDKILETNKMGINSVSALEDKIAAGRGAINDFYNENRDPGRKTLKRILSLPGLNPEWWQTGHGQVFKDFSDENHASVQNGSDNKQKVASGDPEVYRTIVEGNTEYVLIPREVLKGTKIISAEQIANDRKIMDRLLEQNEKMIAKLLASESKHPGVEKGQDGP